MKSERDKKVWKIFDKELKKNHEIRKKAIKVTIHNKIPDKKLMANIGIYAPYSVFTLKASEPRLLSIRDHFPFLYKKNVNNAIQFKQLNIVHGHQLSFSSAFQSLH